MPAEPSPTTTATLSPVQAQRLIVSVEAAPRKKDAVGAEDWIPLYQSLLWPAVLVAFLCIYRRPIYALMTYLSERIREGSPLEVAGVKLGAGERPKELTDKGENPAAPPELPNTIYITHRAIRDPLLDRQGRQYYRLTIALDADTPKLLDQVERVVYHLHPTFRNPDRETTDRDRRFEITTIAWGEFNMVADVHLKDPRVLQIERYINF